MLVYAPTSDSSDEDLEEFYGIYELCYKTVQEP